MSRKEHRYYVYIVANRTRVIYCGMTDNLERRVAEHKSGAHSGFTESYNCNRLVWYERYQYVYNAINREKQIKRWTRAKKLTLIGEMNSAWVDLSEEWDPQFAYGATVAVLRKSNVPEPEICTFPNRFECTSTASRYQRLIEGKSPARICCTFT